MATVTHEMSVAASPQVVWGVLADFDRIAGWAQDIDHSCRLTERQDGVGAERRVQIKSTVVLERITVWQPEKTLAYEVIGLPPVVSSFVNEWTLEADGDRTQVTLVGHVEPGPKPPMKPVARLVARLSGSVHQRLLRDLAAAAADIAASGAAAADIAASGAADTEES